MPPDGLHYPPHWRDQDRRRWFWQGFMVGCSASSAVMFVLVLLT